MKKFTSDSRRIYGPNFDPNLVITAALRAKHHGDLPLIAVYGASDDQRYAAIESLIGQAYVLDINHPETSQHIQRSLSIGEPVVVGINPRNAPLTFITMDVEGEYSHHDGTPEWLRDNYDLIYDANLRKSSVTVDLDSEDVTGIESAPWDFGYQMFPVHPLKRAQSMSLEIYQGRDKKAQEAIDHIKVAMDQGHRPNDFYYEAEKEYVETLIDEFGWRGMSDIYDAVLQGRELPRLLDQLILTHTKATEILKFISDQQVGAA